MIIATLLITLGVLGRTLPHWWNVAPIAAIGIIAAAYLGWRYALAVPIIALAIGDIFFLGTYDFGVMASVYVGFALVALYGLLLRNNKNVITLVGVPLAASVTFYLVTNFSVWAFSPWYAKTLDGLIQCYYLALPFFRNTLLGDLVYTTSLIATFETARKFIPLFRNSFTARTPHLLEK